MNNISLHQTAKIISDLLKNMNFVPGQDSNSIALDWLQQHDNTFCGFVNGSWLKKENIENEMLSGSIKCFKFCDHYSKKHLCDIYYFENCSSLSSFAVKYEENLTYWSSISPINRSRLLHKVAETIKNNQSLFSSIESLSSGKHLYKTRTQDIPNLIESFNYYAACALAYESDLYSAGCAFVICEEYNNPLLSLNLRVAPLLASGQSVFLFPDKNSCLSALLLAQICKRSGIPSGVINVLPIEVAKFSEICKIPRLSKLVFTGSSENAKQISLTCSDAHIPCETLIIRRPVVIIYDNADFQSAAYGIFEMLSFYDTRCESGGCKVMIQESAYEKFLKLLKEHLKGMLIGNSNSKTDLSCAVSECQYRYITKLEAEEKNLQIYEKTGVKCEYTHIAPHIINCQQIHSKLINKEVGGPIIITVPFRTVKESIAMFNSNNKGCPVSIWSEKVPLVMEVAHKLKTGTVWINSQNLFNASVAFSGVHGSGNSVEGGEAALFQHLSIPPDDSTILRDSIEYPGKKKLSQLLHLESENVIEYKQYIHGRFVQSEKDVIQDKNTFIPHGSVADINNAVISACAAQPKWELYSRNKRSQILYSISENMQKNKEGLINSFNIPDDASKEQEFNVAKDEVYYWSMKCKTYNGETQVIAENVKIFQEKIPIGVISIICPVNKPLLSFLHLVIPAIMTGNTVVAIASIQNLVPILKMCEIFQSSGLPAGVINVVIGDPFLLISDIRKHKNVDAVWYSDIKHKYIYSCSNIFQRVFYCEDKTLYFEKNKCDKYIYASTFIKSIYVPMGDIFAN